MSALVGAACAAAQRSDEPTVEELSRKYRERLRVIERTHKADLGGADKRYLDALEQLANQMLDLGTASEQAIAAVKAERERFKATPTLDDANIARRPRSLGLRQRAHLEAVAGLQMDRSRSIVRLADAYQARLDQVLRQLKRSGKHEEVAAVEAEMKRVADSATVQNARRRLTSPATVAAAARDSIRLPPELAGDLSLHFSFDMPSALRIPDASGNDHIGTPSGARRVGSGRIGAGCSFDGNMSNIQVSPGDKLSPERGFTISFWIHPATRSRRPAVIVERNADKGIALSLSAFDPKVIYSWAAGERGKLREIQTADAIPFADWSHVAVAHGLSGVTVYIDGEQAARADGETPPPAAGDARIAIGAKLSSYRPRDFFAGKLDEFMWFRRAISPDEAAALFKAVGGSAGE